MRGTLRHAESFAAMAQASVDDHRHRLTQALGTAVVHVWAEIPQSVQEKLFEHAVVAGHRSERDESLREQLAKFLHDHHERTQRARGD